jgi:hypothetical protein
VETGAWLSVIPFTINGTELSAQEFRDKLLIRYLQQPLDPPDHYDGCSSPNLSGHALECKVGGLVMLWHNEIVNDLVDLSDKALVPLAARDKPLIPPTVTVYTDPTSSPAQESRSTFQVKIQQRRSR